MRRLTLVFSSVAAVVNGQSLERSVIASAGATLSGGGIVLSTTVGQIANAVKPGASVAWEEGFQPTTGYEHWASSFSGLGGPADDPDGDGRCNALEYALGSNPFTRDSSPAVHLAVSSGGMTNLSVLKAPQAGKDAQVVYRIEMSSTLIPGSWSSTELITLVDTPALLVMSVNSFPSRAFFRLRVTVDTVTP